MMGSEYTATQKLCKSFQPRDGRLSFPRLTLMETPAETPAEPAPADVVKIDGIAASALAASSSVAPGARGAQKIAAGASQKGRSKANISDLPSRDDYELLEGLGVERVRLPCVCVFSCLWLPT